MPRSLDAESKGIILTRIFGAWDDAVRIIADSVAPVAEDAKLREIILKRIFKTWDEARGIIADHVVPWTEDPRPTPNRDTYDQFGNCPQCGGPTESQSDVNVGTSFYVICAVHRVFWPIGDQYLVEPHEADPATWEANQTLNLYTQVEPLRLTEAQYGADDAWSERQMVRHRAGRCQGNPVECLCCWTDAMMKQELAEHVSHVGPCPPPAELEGPCCQECSCWDTKVAENWDDGLPF